VVQKSTDYRTVVVTVGEEGGEGNHAVTELGCCES
jgi:hypothetical protein